MSLNMINARSGGRIAVTRAENIQAIQQALLVVNNGCVCARKNDCGISASSFC